MTRETIRLFHGSRNLFDVFSKDVEPRFDTGQALLGYFMTDSPDRVLAYARGAKGHVYVVEASFTSMKTVAPARSGMCEIDRMQLDYNEDDFAAYRENLVSEGHDAVCFESLDGYSEYVFLDERQLEIISRLKTPVFRRRVLSGDFEQPALSVEMRAI